MTRQTEVKNNLSRSIGAGLASLTGKSGRTYCVLQHRTTSQLHRSGENQEIIVDYAEIGRNPKCVVRFGEDSRTVSGLHAAIYRQENAWVIKHLSKTNPTLVNGRPVNNEWYLNHGDEIQLSVEGPRIGFLIPANPAVSSIGLSRRLSLFREQALRPYRRALIAMGIVFLIAVTTLGYFLYQSMQANALASVKLNELKTENASIKEQQVKDKEQQSKVIGGLQKEINRLKKYQRPPNSGGGSGGGSTPPPSVDGLKGDVYFVYTGEVTVAAGDKETTVDNISFTGTAFLLDDGRLITARHVVEPWFYLNNESPEILQAFNIYANNGGKVTAKMLFISPNGNKFTLTNEDFRVDRSGDKAGDYDAPDGNKYTIRLAGQDANDWAVARINRKGSIGADASTSTSLKTGSKLFVLGYPRGLGATDDPSKISPLYSEITVSQDGLRNGYIMISDQNIDHGNSGGPVFVLDAENRYHVVGIVSAGVGSAVGLIVPIAAVR